MNDTNSELEGNDEEIWKDVVGYEGMYKVSNLGNVKSFINGKNILLKGTITKKGYRRISFHARPILKQFLLHRLVAIAFIENNNNFLEINHINGNKLDNNVKNLEWCTSKYNSWHKFNVLKYNVSDVTKNKISLAKLGIPMQECTKNKISISHKGLKRSEESIKKTALGHIKKVFQLDLNENKINAFNSLKEASLSTNTSASCISNVCNGLRKTANGYKWKYD